MRRRLYEEPEEETSLSLHPAQDHLATEIKEQRSSGEVVVAPSPDEDIQALKANIVIQDAVVFSMALSLVPVPLFASLSLTAIQLRMISKLAAVYEVPYERESVRAFLTSLLGGAAGVVLGEGSARILRSLFPTLGALIGGATVVAVNGALTRSVGELFHAHFRTGGTTLQLEVDRMRSRFRTLFSNNLAQEKS